jgi:hypothetical protein
MKYNHVSYLTLKPKLVAKRHALSCESLETKFRSCVPLPFCVIFVNFLFRIFNCRKPSSSQPVSREGTGSPKVGKKTGHPPPSLLAGKGMAIFWLLISRNQASRGPIQQQQNLHQIKIKQKVKKKEGAGKGKPEKWGLIKP